jgi:glycosyltransferase involved in cell wall biosynthesis
MKIAICIPNLSGGGAERQVQILSSGLAEHNINVTLIYLRDGPENHKKSHNINLIKLDDGNKVLITLKLYVFLLKNKFDVVISANLFFDIVLGIMSKVLFVNLVIRESNSREARDKSIRNWVRMFLNKSTYIVSNNKSGLDMWLGNGNRGLLIPNGYDLNQLVLDEVGKSGILIGGRFIKRKRIREAIGFALQHHELRRHNITVFGDGIERSNIKRGLEDKQKCIRFVGFIPHNQVIELMRQSRYYISLSEYEGTPNVVLEALSSGCEVILSDVASHRDCFPEEIVTYVKCDSRTMDKCNLKQTDPEKRRVFCNSWSKEKMVTAYANMIHSIRPSTT